MCSSWCVLVAALIEPHDGVPQLLELGEDLLALPPEAAGEEGLSSELNAGSLLEVGVGIGDLGVDGHKEVWLRWQVQPACRRGT